MCIDIYCIGDAFTPRIVVLVCADGGLKRCLRHPASGVLITCCEDGKPSAGAALHTPGKKSKYPSVRTLATMTLK